MAKTKTNRKRTVKKPADPSPADYEFDLPVSIGSYSVGKKSVALAVAIPWEAKVDANTAREKLMDSRLSVQISAEDNPDQKPLFENAGPLVVHDVADVHGLGMRSGGLSARLTFRPRTVDADRALRRMAHKQGRLRVSRIGPAGEAGPGGDGNDDQGDLFDGEGGA